MLKPVKSKSYNLSEWAAEHQRYKNWLMIQRLSAQKRNEPFVEISFKSYLYNNNIKFINGKKTITT